jgi:hypothetical protein
MADRALIKVGEAVAGVFLIVACVILRPLLRPWYSKWGTTSAELTQDLPGDEYVPSCRGGYTQAIDIKAPADSVWPWVVQIGQDKAGFYSYELLENMIGCNIHNADRILTEHQDINIGDKLIMHPKAPAVPVIIIRPGEAVVYGGKQDENTANVWIFHFNENEQITRLISRWSFDYKPGLLNIVIYNCLIEPIAAVMQRKMLLGIKKRVEIESSKYRPEKHAEY